MMGLNDDDQEAVGMFSSADRQTKTSWYKCSECGTEETEYMWLMQIVGPDNLPLGTPGTASMFCRSCLTNGKTPPIRYYDSITKIYNRHVI